jgi:hypothetical protein
MDKQSKLIAALLRQYRLKPTPQLLAKIKAIKQRQVNNNWLSQ